MKDLIKQIDARLHNGEKLTEYQESIIREVLKSHQEVKELPTATSRFFIVYYLAKNINGGHNIGDTTFSTDGGFLNRMETVKQIKSLNKLFDDKIVITSITEISKEDYTKWHE